MMGEQILIRPIPGGIRVAINGKDHEKQMSADQMVDLAHQILGRVPETRREIEPKRVAERDVKKIFDEVRAAEGMRDG